MTIAPPPQADLLPQTLCARKTLTAPMSNRASLSLKPALKSFGFPSTSPRRHIVVMLMLVVVLLLLGSGRCGGARGGGAGVVRQRFNLNS